MPYKDRTKLYEAQRRHRIKVRRQLLEYLSIRKCVDCGENDPIVLEFDHTDRSTKLKPSITYVIWALFLGICLKRDRKM